MTGSLSPSPTIWQGKLDLTFTCPSYYPSRKTILSRSYVQAPLKVQRPFYPEGDRVCHSVILHTAGGIVGGDRLSVAVQLEPDAQALITSAAATKVYRSTGLEAQQSIQLQVAPGAYLEWLPQETILFAGALYRQHLKVCLADNATWLGWDITRLGRTARGEGLTTGEWRSKTEVWQNERLIWVDPQWIQGGSTMMHSWHGLAGCPVVGSLAMVGQEASLDLIDQIRACGGEASHSGGIGTQMGVTHLPLGLLCRYRGHSTAEAKQWFSQVWACIRQSQLGRPICRPRVWM